jgi:catecholate siderophore receptor
MTPLLSPNPGDPDNASTFLSSQTKTTAITEAVYALDTIKLNEQWQVMGGLRYDRFAADLSQTAFPNPVTGVSAASLAFSPVNYMLSWRGAVVYKPLPNGSSISTPAPRSTPRPRRCRCQPRRARCLRSKTKAMRSAASGNFSMAGWR